MRRSNNVEFTKNRVVNVAVVTVCLSFAGIGPAHAYVDPGSGSVIVTTILGLVAAIGYTFRKYFYKLRGAFRSGPNKAQKRDRFDD
jgi:hypothetical protein